MKELREPLTGLGHQTLRFPNVMLDGKTLVGIARLAEPHRSGSRHSGRKSDIKPMGAA